MLHLVQIRRCFFQECQHALNSAASLCLNRWNAVNTGLMTARCTVTSKSLCLRQRPWLNTQCAPLPWRGYVYQRFTFCLPCFAIVNTSCDILEIRSITLIEGIRCLTGFTADGYEGQMLNWEELAPVAMWIPLPSFQHSCYTVVPLMASILSISRVISHWKGSKQRCGDSCTNTALSSHCHTLHWHMLLLIQIGMSLGAGDSLFFIAVSLSFFWGGGRISVFTKSLLCVALLCYLCTEEEIAVWLQPPPSREKKPPSPPWAQRASVIPFRMSVTLQLLLACDALRPNCPRRPNTPRK